MENDDLNIDKLKKEATVDNSRLEEMMKRKITPENERKFFEIFKESQLFLPVIYSNNIFEDIEKVKVGDVIEPKGQISFDINYITDSEGNKAVPLFTSSEILESVAKSSSIAIYMSDLAEMLKQSDRYSIIAVNPFTEFDIVMPIQAFFDLFEEPSEEQKKFIESLNKILELLEEHSIELEDNTTLFVRNDENFMIENSVDGIFTPNIPFYASSNPEYGQDLKYTNILLMPKSKKILPIGPDMDLDIVIAPGTEFELQDVMDKTQNLWMCGKQPFYDE